MTKLSEDIAGPEALSIYVAQTSNDLVPQRQKIVRQIEDWGYSVPSLEGTGQQLSDSVNEISAVIKHCVLSVHLLSNQRDSNPGVESVVARQFHLAQAAAIDQIVWIRPGSQIQYTDLPSLEHDAQEQLELVTDRSIEYLKEVIEAKLARFRGGIPPSERARPIVRVFVSHSSSDRKFVEQEIISLLREQGIETWYSREDVDTADEWGEA